MHNPFKYGKQVSGDQFYDRQEVSDDLYRMLSEGSANVVMYAPRRYGKTSLVLKVLERFGADGVPSIHFDVSKVPTLERFLDEYASSVYAIGGKLQNIAHLIEEYVGHLHPTFSVGLNGSCSVRLDYGEKMSAAAISQVLDLPERISVAIGKPIVVAFDEFQDVAVEPTGLFDEKYRSRHGVGVTSTVHSALEQLIDSGIVESDKKGYFIGDPIFALYIRTASPSRVVAV